MFRRQLPSSSAVPEEEEAFCVCEVKISRKRKTFKKCVLGMYGTSHLSVFGYWPFLSSGV
jgi:hypothetical protein